MADDLPAGPKHRSTYADHPALKDVVPVFVGRLPAHVANLRALVAAGSTEELRMVAHKLKGAGKSFGFAGITQLASELEEKILNGRTADEVAAAADALVTYLENVEGYCAAP